ncbi:MAG: hypothetical protein ACTS9Y_01225 [Methylophilus sp.]|uniref:hypothetical protein n=1 Tax=Methylophilus sp. TaxID=29541 RepID=UPI003F9F285B
MQTNTLPSPVIRHIQFDEFVARLLPVAIVGNESEESFSEKFVHPVDSDIVKKAIAANPRKVWTFYEMDGVNWLGSEIGYVNRAGYVITDQSYSDVDSIQVHDNLWIGKSKLVVTCGKDVDEEALEEFITDGIEDIRAEFAGEPYDILGCSEFTERNHINLMVVEIDAMFDESPSSGLLQDLHASFKAFCAKVIKEIPGAEVCIHEELSVGLFFGPDSLTSSTLWA